MTSTRRLAVASFHINVNIGDSAVHLIYSRAGDGERRVERAIFLDGGKSEGADIGDVDARGEPNSNIQKTILNIEDNYDCQGPETDGGEKGNRLRLKFDAFVVSHWDDDHSDGLMWTLVYDVEAQRARRPMSDVLLSRALYQDGQPRSYFYAPTWMTTKYIELPNTDKEGVWPKKFTKYFKVAPDNGGQTLPDDAMLHAKVNGEESKPLLKMRIGIGHLLGRNFFARDDPDANNAPQRRGALNITALLQANPPEVPPFHPGEDLDGYVPGFYCVAVNNQVLGSATGLTTYKNRTSICNLVIWNNGHVSLYSAGDAHAQLEWNIAQWVGYTENDPVGIRIVKMSHHGASTSNPMGSWELFKPYHVVASSGDHPSYGHPRWEVLLAFHAWKLFNCTPLAPSTHPLLLTQYPYYLKDQQLNAFKESRIDVSTWSAVSEYMRAARQKKVDLRKAKKVEGDVSKSLADYILKKFGNRISALELRERIFDYLQEKVLPTGLFESKYLEDSVIPLQYVIFEHGSDDGSIDNLSGHKTEWFELVVNQGGGRANVGVNHSEPLSSSGLYTSNDSVSACSLNSLADQGGWEVIAVNKGQQSHRIVDDKDVYRIVAAEANQGGQNVAIIPMTSSLHSFLFFLPAGEFRLQKEPESGVPVDFAADDEWQLWLRKVLQSSSAQLHFTAAKWPPGDHEIGTYDMEANISSQRKLTIRSKNAAAALGVSADAIEKMVSEAQIMPFAVTFESSGGAAPWTLKEVADFVGFEHSTAIELLKDATMDLATGDQARNALWFDSAASNKTTMRLEFIVRKEMYSKFSDWLDADGKKFAIQSISVIAKRQHTCNFGPDKDTAIVKGEIALKIELILCQANYTAYAVFSETEVRLRLQKDRSKPGESALKALADWAVQSLKLGGFDCESLVESASSFLDAIKPRVVDLRFGREGGKLKGINALTFVLQVELKKGKKDGSESLVFFITYAWSKQQSSLKGVIWTAPSPRDRDVYKQALPEWEEFLDLKPDVEGKAADHVDLKALLELNELPAGVPTEVYKAELEVTKTGISFFGILVCKDESDKSKIPMLALDRLELDCSLSWEKQKRVGTTATKWEFSLIIDMLLMPLGKKIEVERSDAGDTAARLRGLIKYGNTNGFLLQGRLDGLTVAHLSPYWDADSREGAMAMLKHLKIDYLELKYFYASGDKAGGKSFSFSGAISFGDLQLKLNFDHNGTVWTFALTLGLNDEASGNVTVASFLKTVLGDDAPDIPGAVGDIVLAKPGKEGEVFSLKCSLIPGPNDSKLIMFAASVHISSISLSLLQWRDKAWNAKVPSKRVIKVAVGEIGPFDAPIVGKINQPFDQLAYVWVSDKASGQLQATEDAPPAGISKGELDALMEPLDQKDKLFYKSDKKDEDKDVVIKVGSHFMIIAKDSEGKQTAMLDYVFERPKSNTKSIEFHGELLEDKEKNEDVSKAPFKKSIGPLTFENIGLQYIQKEQRLGVVLDAGFLMGPIGIELLGFCLSVQVGKGKSSLLEPIEAQGSMPVSNPKVSLAGLAVSFDKPPVTIAGGFMKTTIDGGEYYAGGLIIGFKPWMLQAMGVYGKAPRQQATQRFMLTEGEDEEDLELDSQTDDAGTFTMVFVIFKLEGPLFTVGFADISGLTGGVGVNTYTRLPNAESVLDFPFVKPNGTDGGGPLKTLKSLLFPTKGDAWFTPREGSFWVAAGLKAKAFQMLSVDAVIVLQLNPDVQLGIYGVAVCDVPSLESSIKFAHVELGIACTLDVKAGTFKFEAQLSPRSYVLHESCHLTGGMALYSWFGNSVNAGDWVLTIGGFHQAYNKPPQYPSPPRLGINWSLSGSLRITGEAYFAITPRVCMGGGRLHAALTLGALSAWFDAYLDFLINYRPFHFQALGGISVGIRYSMDLLLVTVRISAEISASLFVAGPPMGGTVHVDFWVFGFDINFGNRSGISRPPLLSLTEFKAVVLKSAGGTGTGSGLPLGDIGGGWIDVAEDDVSEAEDEMDESAAPATKPFLFNCESGLIPENDESQGKSIDSWLADKPSGMWTVEGGSLSFTVTTAFAFSAGTLFDKRVGAVKPEKEAQIEEPQKKIYALPMALKNTISSRITVTVTEEANMMVKLRTAPEERSDEEWGFDPILKSVPLSIWGKYDPDLDPASKGNYAAGLLSSSGQKTVTLAMGLTLTPPLPYISHDKIPKFNLVKDFRQTVNPKGYPFLEKVDADAAWVPLPQAGDWDKFKEVWKQHETRPVDVVNAWAKRLNFPDGAITGTRPKSLLKRFDDLVPALPLIAVGAGAV